MGYQKAELVQFIKSMTNHWCK